MTFISIHNWNRICDILTPLYIDPGPIYRMIFWPRGKDTVTPGYRYFDPFPIAHPSTGIDADVSKGETRSGYFGSKLVLWNKCGILVLQVLFVTVIMIMLCIFPKKNRVLTSLCNNYQHRCVNATCSTCVTRLGQWEIYALVNYASIGVCNVLSPLHCVAIIYFDLWL